jgi:hypothetical protein
MKRFTLLLALFLATVAFVPAASALPVFSRQTGMACNACHFQHFPMLSSFGRSFKAAGYTMMGAQAKIEGVEGNNLSIPENLNMAVLTTAGYEKSNGTSTGAAGSGTKTADQGSIYVPGTNGELSLFMGGRISDFAGFLAEIGVMGGAALGSAKMPVLFEVADDTRAGVVMFTTDAQGASYGFELLNTGANAVHQMSSVGGFDDSHHHVISAQQYLNTNQAATGAALVVNSSKGFVNLTKFHQVGPGDLGGTGASLGSTYLRAVGMFDLAGFDSAVGVQSWSGSSTVTALTSVEDTKATAIDAQMQGEFGGKPLGIYVTYARAPGSGTITNVYNGGTLTRSSFNVAAELGVIPEKVTVGAAIRRGMSGIDDGTGTNLTDNALFLTATYKLAQNMVLSLSLNKQSGSNWDAANAGSSAAAGLGNTTTTLNLFTLF